MSGKFFIDTNILIYFYTGTEEAKRDRLQHLLGDASLAISTQVLHEMANVLLKKFKTPHDKIAEVLHELSMWCFVYTVEMPTIMHALSIIRRYNISYFDGLMLAAAMECDCKTIYSEDMQHECVIDGVLSIINPFK